jgi:hypothetical protein
VRQGIAALVFFLEKRKYQSANPLALWYLFGKTKIPKRQSLAALQTKPVLPAPFFSNFAKLFRPPWSILTVKRLFRDLTGRPLPLRGD